MIDVGGWGGAPFERGHKTSWAEWFEIVYTIVKYYPTEVDNGRSPAMPWKYGERQNRWQTMSRNFENYIEGTATEKEIVQISTAIAFDELEAYLESNGWRLL